MTSLNATDMYLSLLRNLQKAYNIQANVLKCYDPDVSTAIESVDHVEKFLKLQVKNAKTFQQLSISTLQGPHGVPATKTIASVSLLKSQLVETRDTTKDINVDFLSFLDLRSFLTLVNEHLHGIIRMQNLTPTVLDCAQCFIPEIQEII